MYISKDKYPFVNAKNLWKKLLTHDLKPSMNKTNILYY